MNKDNYILAINPGSTSTKIAVFKEENELFTQNIYHNDQEIAKFKRIWDQYSFRKKEIISFVREGKFDLELLTAVVGRGGLFRPILSGTYVINKTMLDDARSAVQGEHASNLGAVLAYGIAWDYNISSFIVDPPCVDEMEEVARLSGNRAIKRRSLLHALNIKAMARLAAESLKKPLNELNLIVAHIGGGISVTPLRKGRMIDTSNALSAGPFSPERSGSLPTLDLLSLITKDGIEMPVLKKMLVGKGGVFSYLNTKNMIEVESLYKSGDKRAKLVMNAMGYQIAKEIGAMATTLNGKVDGIILTGGVAHSRILTDIIKKAVSFIGKIIILPGEDELKALVLGALRVIKGVEKPLEYPQQVEYEELF